MSEAVPAWQVDVLRNAVVLRSAIVGETGWSYPASQRGEDGTLTGESFDIRVRQIGTFGLSEPVSIVVNP